MVNPKTNFILSVAPAKIVVFEGMRLQYEPATIYIAPNGNVLLREEVDEIRKGSR